MPHPLIESAITRRMETLKILSGWAKMIAAGLAALNAYIARDKRWQFVTGIIVTFAPTDVDAFKLNRYPAIGDSLGLFRRSAGEWMTARAGVRNRGISERSCICHKRRSHRSSCVHSGVEQDGSGLLTPFVVKTASRISSSNPR
jgi:hypothetical protein